MMDTSKDEYVIKRLSCWEVNSDMHTVCQFFLNYGGEV